MRLCRHICFLGFQEMTAELLKRSHCNVIVIDWGSGANPPYTQAVANIRLVGVMTAHLINNLVKDSALGIFSEKIHVIGHSLGAHLASYIGNALQHNFKMKLGRITGKKTVFVLCIYLSVVHLDCR